jgi:hypothetical protein
MDDDELIAALKDTADVIDAADIALDSALLDRAAARLSELREERDEAINALPQAIRREQARATAAEARAEKMREALRGQVIGVSYRVGEKGDYVPHIECCDLCDSNWAAGGPEHHDPADCLAAPTP